MRRTILLLLLGSALVAAPGLGQSAGAALQFNFSNPGARSLGLAGAFAGLADDATAAFANPAGLVQLVRPEVSIEGRLWQYRTPFVAGGRVSGEPTGILLDDTSGLRFGEDESDLSGVSFLSFVYPLKRGCLAFFQYQLANFEVASETQGLFAAPFERRDEIRQRTDFEIVSHGVAGALRLSERLDVGLALVYSEADLRLVEEEFFVGYGTVEEVFGPLPLTPENLEDRVMFGGGDSTAWSLHGGFLWQVADRWSVGGFFRQGPEFDSEITQVAGPKFEDFFAVPGQVLVVTTTPIVIPDVFGLGIVFRSAGDALTVSLEWDRVEYSDLVENLSPALNPEELSLDDGDELHVGFEYAFLRTSPLLAVRAGWWHDPDHQLKNIGSDNLFDRAIFRGGEDAGHFTAGIGVKLRSLQIDLGVDLSEFIDTLALSGIYSF